MLDQKIGFVIPWYGENEPGGIERELRGLLGRLQREGMEVEVITTCVKEFRGDWNENYYAAGTAVVDDIQVRRFPVQARDVLAYQRLLGKLTQGFRLSMREEQTLLEESINSPLLYEYLAESAEEYGVLVFLPYGCGITYFGMQCAPDRAVLLPCFQDGPLLGLRLFRQEYVRACGVIYHTKPEWELAGRLYDFTVTRQICIGCGIETQIQTDPAAFREAYQIDGDFMLYVGRKDGDKNVPLLLRYFAELRRRQETELKLVLIGDGEVEIPPEIQDEVYDLGYLEEQDKLDAMAAAVLFCQPSRAERFSTVLMESWMCGTPALVNAQCAVTREFVKAAGGGLYFRDYFEFEGSIGYLLSHPETAAQMGQSGREYVRHHFNWDTVTAQYRDFLKALAKE